MHEAMKGTGEKCSVCGEMVTEIDIECVGAKERNEPMPRQQVCRCIHPGDLFCNCGKPCWSFF